MIFIAKCITLNTSGEELPEELGKYIWLTKADTSQEAPASKSGSSSLKKLENKYASVAQLDRASDYGSEGYGFNSCQVRHFIKIIQYLHSLKRFKNTFGDILEAFLKLFIFFVIEFDTISHLNSRFIINYMLFSKGSRPLIRK